MYIILHLIGDRFFYLMYYNYSKMKKPFRYNLGRLRIAKGLSQEKLAEKISVARQTVSKWENGETYPSTEHILLLAGVLNCGIDDLIGKTKQNTAKTIWGSTALVAIVMIVVFACGFVTATAIMYFCQNDEESYQCEYLNSAKIDKKEFVKIW